MGWRFHLNREQEGHAERQIKYCSSMMKDIFWNRGKETKPLPVCKARVDIQSLVQFFILSLNRVNHVHGDSSLMTETSQMIKIGGQMLSLTGATWRKKSLLLLWGIWYSRQSERAFVKTYRWNFKKKMNYSIFIDVKMALCPETLHCL